MTTTPTQLKLAEIMVTTVHRVTPQMKLREVAEMMIRHQISGAPIVDGMDQVISIIGEGDTLRLAASEGLEATVAHCLAHLPTVKTMVTLKAEDEFAVAYRIFLKHKYHRIPIVSATGHLKGLVTRSTILTLFVEAHYGRKIVRPSI